MLLTQDLIPLLFPWLCLVITIIVTFVKPKLWPYGLFFTLVSGLIYNAIDLVGLGVITLLFILAFFANKYSEQTLNKDLVNTWQKIVKTVLLLVVVIGCIALAAHLLPGFNNLHVLSNVEKSLNSMPFSLFLNFDKPMILFVLLILYPSILMKNKSVSIKLLGKDSTNKLRLSLVVFVSFILIFTLALSLSLISFEPQLPSWWWLFALNNLLLTCVMEEVFFRGFIQTKLTKAFNPIVGLVIASLLFGIAHFAGGLSYVLVATLAGFLYGFVYLNTGRLWLAIVIHFVLNMVHVYLFTYPLLKL